MISVMSKRVKFLLLTIFAFLPFELSYAARVW